MAIINTTFGFVFVHVPKTAGTTVTSQLARYTRYCDMEVGGTEFGELLQPIYQRRFKIRKHSTMAEIRNVIGEKKAAQFFKFAFSREPLSRALSTFHFLRKWEGAGDYGAQVLRFVSFEDFVMSDLWGATEGPDQILRPQASWLTEPRDPSLLIVDYVGKVETLRRSLEEIATKIGLPEWPAATDDRAIPVANSSGDYEKSLNFSAGVMERIHNRYKSDYDLFKY